MLRSALCRGLTATAGVVLVLGVFALPASAAEPAVKGCVGSTLAPPAAVGSPPFASAAFGQIVVPFAQNSFVPGFGAEIQAIQTGGVPDEVANNTCND